MTPETFLDGRVTLWRGDCLEVLDLLPENSVDSCVTDPPYHLVSITKRFGKPNSAPCQYGRDGAFARQSRGFMSKLWDGGDIAFRPETWAKVLRVLKPGAHLLAFGGDRTQHRVACAVEDAGFDIRHTILWTFGSGFPKSHNLGNGWGTALKPAAEFVCMARKPLSEPSIAANVLRHGVGGINIDGCRVPTEPRSTHSDGNKRTQPGQIYGGGKGLPVCEYPAHSSRWPANLIHDGSEEVLAGFPDVHSAGIYGNERNVSEGMFGKRTGGTTFDDSGSAARFFYTAKADADDRLGSKHPTVKPLDLMQYLVRLITNRGGCVLDPFAGTGTTGEAAWREGFRAALIEREPEYQADIVKRMGLCLSGPDARLASSIKQSGHDDLPLFAEVSP